MPVCRQEELEVVLEKASLQRKDVEFFLSTLKMELRQTGILFCKYTKGTIAVTEKL